MYTESEFMDMSLDSRVRRLTSDVEKLTMWAHALKKMHRVIIIDEVHKIYIWMQGRCIGCESTLIAKISFHLYYSILYLNNYKLHKT
jgi:hypothetical protein